VAIRSKISLTNELRIAIALLEIPVSGWTCLRTAKAKLEQVNMYVQVKLTLVDVGRVSLLSDLLSLLLLTIGSRRLGSLFRSFQTFGFGGGLAGGGSRSFAGSRSGFGGHCNKVSRVGGDREEWVAVECGGVLGT